MKIKIVSLAAAALLAGSSFALAQTAGNNAGVGAPGTTPGQENKAQGVTTPDGAGPITDKSKMGGSATGTTGMKPSGAATTTNGQSNSPAQTNGAGNVGTGKGVGTGN